MRAVFLGSWHPGPVGHELVADMLFMHYAEVFLRALERLDEVEPGTTVTQLREKSLPSRLSLGKTLGLGNETLVARVSATADDDTRGVGTESSDIFMGKGRGSVLPPPVWCKGLYFCRGAGNYRCANTYVPLAGKEGSRLVDMVSERTGAVLNRDRQYFDVQPSEGHWAVTLNENVYNIVHYMKEGPPKGMHLPIDMKWVLVGGHLSGPIEFEFETIGFLPIQDAIEEDTIVDVGNDTTLSQNTTVVEDSQLLAVCKPDFIDRVELSNSSAVRFCIDGVEALVVREMDHYGLNAGSCVILGAEIGVGRHTLTVEPLDSGGELVAISHVLYPA